MCQPVYTRDVGIFQSDLRGAVTHTMTTSPIIGPNLLPTASYDYRSTLGRRSQIEGTNYVSADSLQFTTHGAATVLVATVTGWSCIVRAPHSLLGGGPRTKHRKSIFNWMILYGFVSMPPNAIWGLQLFGIHIIWGQARGKLWSHPSHKENTS